jgi:hypothetical protein
VVFPCCCMSPYAMSLKQQHFVSQGRNGGLESMFGYVWYIRYPRKRGLNRVGSLRLSPYKPWMR